MKIKINLSSAFFVVITFFFGSINLVARAQNSLQEIREKIVRQISLDYEKIPDSVSMYTFAVNVTVIDDGKKTKIETVAINNDFGKNILVKKIQLDGIDFSSILTEKQIIHVVIPVMVMIYNTKKPFWPRQLPLNDVLVQLNNLFDFKQGEKFKKSYWIYLAPYAVYASKAILD